MSMKKLCILTAILFLMSATLAATAFAAVETTDEGAPQENKFMAMAVSVSISCLGAGYAVAHTGSASLASITEKPELFGRTIIYVGMAEGIAIYGLLIAFLIWIS